MVANKTLIFKKVPNGFPVPGQDLVVEDRPLDLEAPPPSGGLVVEILYASLDPYLRGKMRDSSVKSYTPAWEIDGPIVEATVARVLATDTAKFKVGDLAVAYLPIAQYARISADELGDVRPIQAYDGLHVAHSLGALGMPGLTAYSSLWKIGQPKAGETIFVSSAAGAVGQLVGQIAKRQGLRVIGSVGSAEKLAFIVDELGFDGGFNYKEESPFAALPRLAPEGIDIYFENVGGDHLEAALQNMNNKGRIPVCGMISEYNQTNEEKRGVKGLFHVISKQLTLQGFIVRSPEFGPAYYKEHQEYVRSGLLDGSIKAKLSISEGIENAAHALVGLFRGENFGKAVLKI